ncbi:hypothetical protein DWQ65_08000 [Treponema phagedenis]|uniref:Uncharacterized protein n=1 Tax=Treponema phagedenis TaxID=162 RepID=A0A0B7GSB7_TREPH|nr:hypothetical protein HMPREF9554_00752 [Treponema phagedenis F0421]QSH94333.1 hypothetical protein C5O78_04635 [Treponema phagedenis]QSI00005.1 hypothetical protein DWQ65_08000 [Treponema phagedenis]CEM61363.1 conserved hypothetical protein [Treponema phagedenis]
MSGASLRNGLSEAPPYGSGTKVCRWHTFVYIFACVETQGKNPLQSLTQKQNPISVSALVLS